LAFVPDQVGVYGPLTKVVGVITFVRHFSFVERLNSKLAFLCLIKRKSYDFCEFLQSFLLLHLIV
jgi:hypothetical protein